YRRESGREGCHDWSRSNRNARQDSGAHGRARPRHHSLTKITFDTVFGRVGLWRATYSFAAPTRSHVRSAPERSALSETGFGWTEIGDQNTARGTLWYLEPNANR